LSKMAARKGINVSKEQLLRWYHEERKSTSDIAALLEIDQANVIYWMKKLDVSRRSKSEALTKTWRADFSGDPEEKAYLIGFRLGDLHVYQTKPESGQTIRIMCASSKRAQIDLIRALFEPYGYVKITPKIDGKTAISCYVNMSFDFLLPKQDVIEEWILSDENSSIAFLAGYIDAEGSFSIDANGSANVKLETYDVGILHQLYEILTRVDVICPPPNLIKNKETAKQKLNQDLWRLGVYRRASIDRLCSLLETYLRHEQRRQDMMISWQNARDRIAR
jgi:intein-encoded DNA endonuclease-like protein